MDILELQNQLDTLSSWRKAELMQAHYLAENSVKESEKKYLCRTWVLIMYAHCDSFLKESSKAYVEYLRSNMISGYEHKLMWLIMRGKDALTKGNKSYISLDNYYILDNETLFNVILSKDVFERSSFKYELIRFFCDWVIQMDYPHNDFSEFSNTLKQKRDAIAHGEESYVGIESDCLPWHHKTIEFIDTFKDAILQKVKMVI